MTRKERARQRHRRPLKHSVYTLHGKTRVGAVNCSAYGRRVPHPIAAVICFLFAAILVSPIFGDVARARGMGSGVLAAPCGTGNTTAGGRTPVRVSVTPTTGLNLTMFNCEGGDFEVNWSGVVTVRDTIYIGFGTTVNIMGESIPINTSDTAAIPEASCSINTTGHVGVDDPIATLSIPRGLPSAAVRDLPLNMSEPPNGSISFGPIFYVDGGELLLQNMAIRGGYVSNSTNYPDASGGGIYAQRSNVTATWCEFEDNFAESEGGGIFANASTLVVVGSVFRRCRAGFRPVAGEEASGAGGGINNNGTDTFIFGCHFEDCYASKKGGGMQQGGGGRMSVLNSSFCRNSAGSNNEKDEDEVGEAGALSISTCDLSFDSEGGCSVNDTAFAYNHVARKGGAVNIGTGASPSHVEFHRCAVANSTTGEFIEDDPQGEGGVFNLAPGTRLLLSDSLFIDNHCGNKGGVLSLSSGFDWQESAGAIVIMRTSTFDSNYAEGNAGVVSLADYTTLVVAGEGNVFRGNECGEDGGVFRGTTNTTITVEGGLFENNFADGNGGVMGTKGTIKVLGGRFLNNKAKDSGGVIIMNEESTIMIAGGEFEGNEAPDGGVVFVGSDSNLSVAAGRFSDNEASNFGGALFVGEDGILKITGGYFSGSEADFGGFLYKEGEGHVSCVGAVISKSQGVDGGAIYAVDDAVLDWACDLNENSAIIGPAIYARDNTTVILKGISIVDNIVVRGAVVFMIESYLETYQVEFKDTSKSSELSAIEFGKESSYTGEDTSFVGFQGEAVVFSEGSLFLDDCDFSRSNASQLVYTETHSPVVIRNTVLGDMNYVALAEASSQARELPTAGSLTNAIVTCQDTISGADTSSLDSPDAYTICSEEHACLEGDLGVYCECYLQRSTMEQRCVNGDATALELNHLRVMNATFFPDMIEGDLRLSHSKTSPSSSMASEGETEASLSEPGTSSSREHGEGKGLIIHDGSLSGVIWNVSALPQLSDTGTSMMNWTIFPSSGMLLPGERVTLRVVTSSNMDFDGTTSVTFNVNTLGSDVTLLTSFDVTFHHCVAGEVWVPTASSLISSDEDTTEGCLPCSTLVEGETEGVHCDKLGLVIERLPLAKGHWRAALDVAVVRKCSNEEACKGGSSVASVQEYCNDGYKGPVCSVCTPGYGRGAAKECHRCTVGFQVCMYFVIAMAAIFALVMMALLAVYLIRGRGAVSSTIVGTKESVRKMQHRGCRLLARSDGGGVIDFRSNSGAGSTRSCEIPGDGIEMAQGVQTKTSPVRNSSVRTSIPKVDPGSISSFGGGPGAGRLGGRLVSARESMYIGRSAPVKPYWRSASSPASPVEARRGTVARDDGSHGGKTDAYGKPSSHCSDMSDGTTSYTSELGVTRGNGRPPATGKEVDEWTTNIWQPQLSPQRGPQGPDAGVNVEVWGQNGEQPQSREEHRAEQANTDTTAAATIGNIMAEFPLSKLKIVIVVWQISSAFSNITSAAYPPIYEKFLAIIGVFSLDLAWILSAACVTTDVDFYDKLLMVTIGPLVFLIFFGVTFYVGAKPTSTTLINVPIRRHPRLISQSDTNKLQIVEPLRSGSVSQGIRTSNISSKGDFQAIDLPRFRSMPQRGRHSAPSGDTTALSDIDSPTRTADASAGQRRIASGTPKDPLASSRIGKSRTATGLESQHRPGHEGREWSGTNNYSASLDDGTVNHEDRGMERTGVEGVVKAMFNPPAPDERADRSLGNTRRSLRTVLKAGPEYEPDLEEDELWGLFGRHTTMTLILLYLVYSQVSTVVFQTFSCAGFPEIGASYLRADERIECYTATHTAYRAYAAVMIFLYPFGVPALFYFLLLRQRSSINPPTDETSKDIRGPEHIEREKIKQRSTDLTIRPTSFLWNAYYPRRYYFEVFECFRRLVLTGFLVFLVPDTAGQVAFGCVFAFASLLAFELQRPHIDALELQLYRTGCLVTFFTNFLALMIKSDVADKNSAGSAAYSVVLIMVNIMFFLSIWWNTWATMKAAFSRRGFQGAVIGVDVVGEDSVDHFLGAKKKKMEENSSHGDGKDVNNQPAGKHPASLDTSEYMEACADSSTSTRLGNAPLLV